MFCFPQCFLQLRHLRWCWLLPRWAAEATGKRVFHGRNRAAKEIINIMQRLWSFHGLVLQQLHHNLHNKKIMSSTSPSVRIHSDHPECREGQLAIVFFGRAEPCPFAGIIALLFTLRDGNSPSGTIVTQTTAVIRIPQKSFTNTVNHHKSSFYLMRFVREDHKILFQLGGVSWGQLRGHKSPTFLASS